MIDRYRRMIDDPARIAAFSAAIAETVRPGAVVVDLGCGFGNYAVLACRAGARRVYAVEVGPILDAARRVAEANGCAERIRFLHGRSTELDVPERADVVIYEDYPITLLSPWAARVSADACARWLAPGGQLLPARARLWAAPVEAAATHGELDRFAAVGDRVGGVDIAPTRRLAFCETVPVQLEAAALVAEPALVADVDLAPLREPAVRFAARVPALRDAALHGLLMWFEMELGGAWLSSGPRAPQIAWKQVLFPLAEPLTVRAGRDVELELAAGPFGEEMIWRWRVAAGGSVREASTLEALGLDAGRLARWDPDVVPKPAVDLEVDRTVLELVDGRRALGDIAAALEARFPARFAEPALAQRRVLEVLRRARGE